MRHASSCIIVEGYLESSDSEERRRLFVLSSSDVDNFCRRLVNFRFRLPEIFSTEDIVGIDGLMVFSVFTGDKLFLTSFVFPLNDVVVLFMSLMTSLPFNDLHF
jgi:hypothetical protein